MRLPPGHAQSGRAPGSGPLGFLRDGPSARPRVRPAGWGGVRVILEPTRC